MYCSREYFKTSRLKRLCCETPILAYADSRKPFRLQTNANGKGLRAAFYQTQNDGTLKVIVYVSNTLSISKKHYDAYKLEFLALMWAATERFHEYLYGREFQIYTSTIPLCTFWPLQKWMPPVRDGWLTSWTTILGYITKVVNKMSRQMCFPKFLGSKKGHCISGTWSWSRPLLIEDALWTVQYPQSH